MRSNNNNHNYNDRCAIVVAVVEVLIKTAIFVPTFE
jgi:hypothetical protein